MPIFLKKSSPPARASCGQWEIFAAPGRGLPLCGPLRGLRMEGQIFYHPLRQEGKSSPRARLTNLTAFLRVQPSPKKFPAKPLSLASSCREGRSMLPYNSIADYGN